MALKDCKIIFDNPWNIYYPGQTVSGKVELVLDKPKKITGIEFTFQGQANVKFTESSRSRGADGKSDRKHTNYTGQETYFKLQYYVIGEANGPTFELSPENITHAFTCVLPPVLPSSFEGRYGHVRYTVKVKLVRPWKFDQEIKAAFTVLSPVDLNLRNELRQPCRQVIEKYFCCCYCRSGPLTCVVSIPCSGYVPGQAINVFTEVDNVSNVDVKYVRYDLLKTDVYYASSPYKYTKRNVVKVLEGRSQPVAKGGSTNLTMSLIIPPIPPSNLVNCGIIDLDYELKIEMVVSGMHKSPNTKIPIIIGTIPLVNMSNVAPLSPVAPLGLPATSSVGKITAPQLPSGSTATDVDSSRPQIRWDDQPPAYSELPPPTFIESMFGTNSIRDNTDNEHTQFVNDDAHYCPMYPVYDFSYNGSPQASNSEQNQPQ